jgi:hypothetical protein
MRALRNESVDVFARAGATLPEQRDRRKQPATGQ